MKVFFLLTICLSLFCSAQQTKIVGEVSFKPEPYETKVFDKSYLNISYEIAYATKPELKDNPRKSVAVLQIGEKFSKFADLKTLQKDSLQETFTRLQSVGAAELNTLLKFRPLFPTVILKSSEALVYQNNVAAHFYEYEEKSPEMKWKLDQESKKILNYTCKKATVHYRGRDYSAWYTTEIPVNNGPYAFQGLPGLILEVTDAENNYRFTAVGIDKKPAEIYLRNEKRILKVSREKYREVQKNYYDNPGAFLHGKALNADGTPLIIKSKPLHYDPMEKE